MTDRDISVLAIGVVSGMVTALLLEWLLLRHYKPEIKSRITTAVTTALFRAYPITNMPGVSDELTRAVSTGVDGGMAIIYV